MCYYSLTTDRRRNARKGDELVVSRFAGGSTGFADAGDAALAVCLRPGTRLVLYDISLLLRRRYGLSKHEEATFVSPGEAGHRQPDGERLRWGNGREVPLRKLRAGLRATVIGVPAEEGRGRQPADYDPTKQGGRIEAEGPEAVEPALV